MSALYQPARWLSMMRRYWKGYLPAFPFLQEREFSIDFNLRRFRIPRAPTLRISIIGYL